MQRLQRKVGVFLPRSRDDADVSLLLQEFEEGDKLLSAIIDATKAFRQAWTDLLQRACGAASLYETLYQPIPSDDPANDGGRYAVTPRQHAVKVRAFREALTDMRDVMLQEMTETERRIILPAKEARKCITVYEKTIKKRQDRKLDYERYKSRVEALEKKNKLSDRENIALAKHQVDLLSSEREYQSADGVLKDSLPGFTAAVYSLLPHLVNAHVNIQSTLLGHYYTALHGFCQQYGYPIPSPEWSQVNPEFDDIFNPLIREVETLRILAGGKAVKDNIASRPDSLQTNTISYNSYGVKNGTPSPRRPSGQSSLPPPPTSPPALDYSSRPSRVTSNSSYTRPLPSPSASTPTSVVSSSDYITSTQQLHTTAGALRRPSQPASVPGTLSHVTSSGSLASSAAAAAVAMKKKPPPPPPPKRGLSAQKDEFVIAQYDFDGEGDGDLRFREGDRIRVVQKTGSLNDWWEGECRGMRGSFPANYCKAT